MIILNIREPEPGETVAAFPLDHDFRNQLAESVANALLKNMPNVENATAIRVELDVVIFGSLKKPASA